MRRAIRAAVPVAAIAIAGCGGGAADYANKPRPATPINVTAAISDRKLSVSPETFGAGPIVLTVSNQTDTEQTLTFETQELGGSRPGLRETTGTIQPGGTGRLKVDVRQGSYEVSTKGGDAVTVEVGEPRPSAQDELLQP